MKEVVIAILSRMGDSGEREFLLVGSKKDFGPFTGLFYPPGGKVEAGESEEETLVRELKEELDLDIRPVERLATTPGDIAEQTTYWWKCETAHVDFKIRNEEIAEARWFTESEATKSPLIWPATQKFFQDYLVS